MLRRLKAGHQRDLRLTASPAVPTRRPPVSTASPPAKSAFRTDSLALGMVFMLAVTVLSRGIGFVRSLWFCRLMDDADVGRWAMAFGFVSLITPVMLLGIPGCMPRFVEHFRRRGQLTAFLARIAAATAGCTALYLIAMAIKPGWFGWLVFLQPENAALIQATGAAVAGMVFYNFASDLAGSLRQMRLVSTVQAIQGVGFTALSIAWLLNGGGLIGIVFMFAASCLVAGTIGFGGLLRLRRNTDSPTEAAQPWTGIGLPARVVTYAAALWVMNLIANAFELSDRYMILHLIGDAASEAGRQAVGQYHAGRIFPTAILSVGLMIAGATMPYLTADHEAGRPERARRRLTDWLVGMSLIFTAGGAVVLWAAPYVFEHWLTGRYAAGQAVMPMAMCFSVWAALVAVGESHLWVIEKGWAIGVVTGIGLVVNLALNAMLIPMLGLDGAVWATWTGHAVVLIGAGIALHRHGLTIDRPLLVAGALPLTLLIPPPIALCLVTAAMVTTAAPAVERLLPVR